MTRVLVLVYLWARASAKGHDTPPSVSGTVAAIQSLPSNYIAQLPVNKDLYGVLSSRMIETAAAKSEANRASNVATAAVVAKPTTVGILKASPFPSNPYPGPDPSPISLLLPSNPIARCLIASLRQPSAPSSHVPCQANFSVYQELCVQPAFLGTITNSNRTDNHSEAVALPSFTGVITYAYDVGVTAYTRQIDGVDSFVTLSATAFDGVLDLKNWSKRIVAPKTPCMAALDDATALDAAYFDPETDATRFWGTEVSSGTLSLAASVLAYNFSSYVSESFFLLDSDRFGSDVISSARQYRRKAIFASMDEDLAQSLATLKRLYDDDNSLCAADALQPRECVARYPDKFNTTEDGIEAALYEFVQKNTSCNVPSPWSLSGDLTQHRFLDTTLFPCGSTDRGVECAYGDPRVADALLAAIADANAVASTVEEQIAAMAGGVDEVIGAMAAGQAHTAGVPFVQTAVLPIPGAPSSQSIFEAWDGSAEELSASNAAIALEWPSGVGELLLEDRAAATSILTDDVQNELVPEIGGDACDATVNFLTILFLALAAFYGAVGGVEGACDAIDVRVRGRRREREDEQEAAQVAPGVAMVAVPPRSNAASVAASPTGLRLRSDHGAALGSAARGSAALGSATPVDEEITRSPTRAGSSEHKCDADGAAVTPRGRAVPADTEAPEAELLPDDDDEGGARVRCGSERLRRWGCLESSVLSHTHPFCNYVVWLLLLGSATFWAPFAALFVQMRYEIAARDYSQEVTGLFLREYRGAGAFNSYALVSAVSLTTACDSNEAKWSIALVILTAFAIVLMQWRAIAVLLRALLWHWPCNVAAKVSCRPAAGEQALTLQNSLLRRNGGRFLASSAHRGCRFALGPPLARDAYLSLCSHRLSPLSGVRRHCRVLGCHDR
ncbi:unnamed protein product [Phaeothamnion confervicola]